MGVCRPGGTGHSSAAGRGRCAFAASPSRRRRSRVERPPGQGGSPSFPKFCRCRRSSVAASFAKKQGGVNSLPASDGFGEWAALGADDIAGLDAVFSEPPLVDLEGVHDTAGS